MKLLIGQVAIAENESTAEWMELATANISRYASLIGADQLTVRNREFDVGLSGWAPWDAALNKLALVERFATMDYDAFLFIDADMIATKHAFSLVEDWESIVETCDFAAVLDGAITKIDDGSLLKLQKFSYGRQVEHYFNSGMFLVNSYAVKMMANLIENFAFPGDCQFGDQPVLNSVVQYLSDNRAFRTRWLPKRFNYFHDANGLAENLTFVHFVGDQKKHIKDWVQ